MPLFSILRFANRVLSSAILITAFSLVIYILRHNVRSAVGRAFCVLLMFVMVVYLGDVVILEATSLASALTWLRFQWLGIAFVPAAYLHFSDALLNTTNSVSGWRKLGVRLSYAFGGLTLILVVWTPWLVRDGPYSPIAPSLQPGPLFWVFTVYFFATVLVGASNIDHARRRCLTSTSRRRMGYLMISFVAPALGVFPYMLLTTLPASLPDEALMGVLLVGNLGVALMIVVMAYTVAYFGAFNPDRVIKYGLIEYLLRGPLLASLALVVLVTVPKIENFLGLPADVATLFAVVLTIILGQVAITYAHPFLNRLVYRQDLAEITWLQELDKRLLTPSDLEQFLENVLSSVAELLRVRHAFVLTASGEQLAIEALCGDVETAQAFLQRYDPRQVLQAVPRKADGCPAFSEIDGYMLRSLCTQGRDAVLGVLAIERWPFAPLASQEVLDLIEQAEFALEDRYLQQGLFVALQQIMPDIERIQKRRQLMHYVASLPGPVEKDAVSSPGFVRWVKDALVNYWGGPKLTHSPLLDLNVVAAARDQCDGDNVRALREVLGQAIEAMRPPGKRSMTSAEWTLYNILDLKFREKHRMSDIANQLAVSESDLYRKQRTAIAEISRLLANMERQAKPGVGSME